MKLIRHSEDHLTAELQDETGIGQMDVYQVFPGIYLGYNDFRLEKCESSYVPDEPVFGLVHCREGKVEWELPNGDYAYLGAGCLMPCSYGENNGHFSFPQRSYQGLSLGISLPRAVQGLPGEFPVDLRRLQQRICSAGTLDLAADARSTYVFGLLYEAQARSMVHKRMACLELFLLLDDLHWEENSARILYFPRAQVLKIKEMEQFLTKNLEHRYTLEELSRRYDLPVNAVRRCFSGIYGESVAAYMKKFRMEDAKRRLSGSDETIASIAVSLGYDTPSKFAAAFRSCARISPQMYRAQFR